MDQNKIILALNDMNFTDYEAKIYLSLLEEFPQNGNSLSQNSGVPNSKVYETLRKMQEKGYVFLAMNEGDSNRKLYHPLPYKDLIKESKKQFNETINLVEDSFNKISKKNQKHWTSLYSIEGYSPTINLIQRSIQRAENEIYIVAWTEEFTLLINDLHDACNRGVKISSITFDKLNDNVPWLHINHTVILKAYEKHKGELAIVVDEDESIVFDSGAEIPNAIVSNYYSMVKSIKNYIQHDLYLNKIQTDLDTEIKQLYGDDLSRFYKAME